MKVFVPQEREAGESRVAASPDTVRRLVDHGAEVVVEAGAGLASRIPDEAFAAAGARTGSAADADVVLKVRRPSEGELAGYRHGAAVFAIMDPYGHDATLAAMAQVGVLAFAMDLMPRIPRARAMDVLSSQAEIAGYQAVVEAAVLCGRAFPTMMAAGGVPAARVFVIGAGVAGLQAIATARRLGAVVTATDVRPAVKREVERLGATFITPETADGSDGSMSVAYPLRQAELTAAHLAEQDIVITAAMIPGRPAPRLVTRQMLEAMKPGSVVVDLAVGGGGNVENVVPDKVVEVGAARVVGYRNLPARVAATASALYAENLFAFLETMIDKETGRLRIDRQDPLVSATLLTAEGRVVHPSFTSTEAAAPSAPGAVPLSPADALIAAAAEKDA